MPHRPHIQQSYMIICVFNMISYNNVRFLDAGVMGHVGFFRLNVIVAFLCKLLCVAKQKHTLSPVHFAYAT